jgi:hypothetical protein
MKRIALLASCLALAACGGGSGGGGGSIPIPTSNDYIQLSNTSSTGETPLGFIAINVSNATSSNFAGMLDHDGGTVSGGSLSGSINDSRTLITLPGGQTATLTDPARTLHTRVFSTSGLSNDLFGVVGQITNAVDIPVTGSSTYNGSVELQADNGTATFALTGNAQINVGWDSSGDVDAVFSGFRGVVNDTGNAQNVAGTVTINDASLNGSSFSGGTFGATGFGLETDYTGGGTQVHEGQIFGPEATEVGGVFGLTSNTLDLSGVYIAKGRLD